jgi:hypothetical protein
MSNSSTNSTDVKCVICYDDLTVPYSFTDTDSLCKDLHVFCINCIYEYLRVTFQLTSYTGTCACPLDRNVYKLPSENAQSILDIININKKYMALLDPNGEFECPVCEEMETESGKFKRKDYFEHWKNTHFNNDQHLSLLKNKSEIPENVNMEFLPAELLTPDALEQQRWIEQQIRNDNQNRNLLEMRIARIQLRQRRQNILQQWKNLWNRTKELKKHISRNPNSTNWNNNYDLIISDISQNQETTNELFDVYQRNNRPRKRSDKNQFNDGNILEYTSFLKQRREQFLKANDNNQFTHREKRLRRKQNKRKLVEDALNIQQNIQSSTDSAPITLTEALKLAKNRKINIRQTNEQNSHISPMMTVD